METKKSNKGGGLAGIIIASLAGIITAIINGASREAAIETKAEREADNHKKANLDDYELAQKKSALRVEERRQMYELEHEHKEKLAKMSSQSTENEEVGGGSQNSLFKPLSVDEVQQLDTLPVVPMAGYYIEQGSLITICAPSGIGKTTIAYQIALHASRGTQPEFVNGTFEYYAPSKGIVYDAENNPEDLNRLLKDYPEIANCPVQIISEPDFDDNEELFLKDIRARVEEDRDEYVVVIDSISTILDTSRSKSIKRFMKGIRRLQSDRIKFGQRITVVVIDHTIKNTDRYKPIEEKNIAGATYITRYSKIIESIFPIKGHDNLIGLYSIKRRFRPSPGTIEILERIEDHSFSPGFKYVDTITEEELKSGYSGSNEGGGPTEAQKTLILKLCNSNPKPSDKEIAKQIGVSERTFANWKKSMGLTKSKP